VHETEKRKRVFIPSWTTAYPWLLNSISGMTRTVCTKFDKTGTFITRCKNYKRDSINQHEKSELLQMFDNEPYESDNEYLDESDDDMQYKDIDYRRNDQSKAYSDLSELLETES
jgi:hypothetical protein